MPQGVEVRVLSWAMSISTDRSIQLQQWLDALSSKHQTAKSILSYPATSAILLLYTRGKELGILFIDSDIAQVVELAMQAHSMIAASIKQCRAMQQAFTDEGWSELSSLVPELLNGGSDSLDFLDKLTNPARKKEIQAEIKAHESK